MDQPASERFRRADAIFDAALDLPADARATYVDRACGEDAELRAAVHALLHAYAQSDGFLSGPAAELAMPFVDAAEIEPESPAPLPGRVGPYRVVREIGHGGMGTVYLAERDDGQFQQRLALKLVRGGLGSDFLVQRFLQERQILASLGHPYIARLLDGGLTRDGVPYFAMEYVEGEPIDRYCASRKLPLDQRVRLIRDVCAAVSYAHRNHVVHRDLKPSNILVTAEGEVKLLDFGVAKLIELDAADTGAPITRTGVRALTPEYAAPEQVRGEAITPATDVYALGMLLYELLVGERPYRLHGHSPAQVERVICETEPMRPSDALRRAQAGMHESGLGPTRWRVAGGASGAHGDRHWRRLRGELDTIVMKALQKEPERRYRSAATLLEDLNRFSEGRPLLARPDSRGYRMRRYLQRNRRNLTPVMAAAAALVAGVLVFYPADTDVQAPAPAPAPPDRILVADFGSTLEDSVLVRALVEAIRVDLAQYPAVRVLSPQQVAVALQHMGRPGELAVNDSLAHELAAREGVKAIVTGEIDRVAGSYVISARLVATSDGEMVTAARESADSTGLMDAVGRLTHRLRRELGETLPSLQVSPPLPRVTTSSLDALRAYSEATRYHEAGDRAEAIRLLEQATAIDPGFATAWRILGGIHGANADAGRATYAAERAIAHSDRLPVRERNLTLGSYHLNVTRDFPQAIAAYRAQLDRDPTDRSALNNLSLVYAEMREHVERERLLLRLLEVDTTVSWTLLGLADALTHQGRFDEIPPVLDLQERRFPDNWYTPMARAYVAAARQDWEGAEHHTRQRLALAIERDHPEHVLDAQLTLGQILLVGGRVREAEQSLQHALALADSLSTPRIALAAAVQIGWLELRYRDRPHRALAIADSALQRHPLERIRSADRPYAELAAFFAAVGEGTRVRGLLALAEVDPDARFDLVKTPGHALRGQVALLDGRPADAIAAFRAAYDDDPCAICMLPALADAYEQAGDLRGSQQTWEQYVHTPWKWRFEPDTPHLARALQWLASRYDVQGRTAEAAAMRERLQRLWGGADPAIRQKQLQADG